MSFSDGCERITGVLIIPLLWKEGNASRPTHRSDMRRIRFFLTVALMSTLASFGTLAQNQPARQAPSSQRPLVIRGGLLIDGNGGAPVPNSIITVVYCNIK